MGRRPTVLIHIDETQRDMHTMYWISLWLEKFGFSTSFCNRDTKDLMWELVRPDIMIDSHFNYYDMKTLEHRSNFTKICVLPAEGALFSERLTTHLYFREGEHDRCRYLAKAFVWGRIAHEHLLKSGHFRPEQLVLTGSPHFDAYLNTDAFRSQPTAKVGMMTTYSVINIFDGRNMLSYYDSMRNKPGIYYAEERNVEDLIWYHSCGFRVTMDLIDQLLKRDAREISIRPHQLENPESYRYIIERHGRTISLDYRMPFYEWTRGIYASFVCKSTAVSDLILAGRPAITIEELMGGRLDDHMNMPDNRIPFLQYVWRPQTCREAVELCQKAKEGKLPIAPALPEIQECISDYFHFPRPQPATYQIAREVAGLYRENGEFFRKKRRNRSPVMMVRNTLQLERLRLLARMNRIRYGCCYSIENARSLRDFWRQNIYRPCYESEIASGRIY